MSSPLSVVVAVPPMRIWSIAESSVVEAFCTNNPRQYPGVPACGEVVPMSSVLVAGIIVREN